MSYSKNAVIEVCYVTRDMDATLKYWIDVMGAGPFFVGDMALADNQYLRGEPCTQSICVAFGFSGDMLIELVQPLDDRPSLFKEVLDDNGPGYHHIMLRADYDEGVATLSDYELAAHGELPGGARYAMFDAREETGGFIEIMEMLPMIKNQFANMEQAARDWDGSTDPIRSLASSFAI